MSNVHVCRRVGIITNLFCALSVKKEGFLKGRYFAFSSPFPFPFWCLFAEVTESNCPGYKKNHSMCAYAKFALPVSSPKFCNSVERKEKNKIFTGQFCRLDWVIEFAHIQGNIWKTIGEFHTLSIERGVIEEKASSSIQL